MSRYGKAWLYSVGVIVLFFGSGSWLINHPGSIERPYSDIVFLLLLSLGGSYSIAFRCRECGTGIFRRGPRPFSGSTLWPQRVCRGCGVHND